MTAAGSTAGLASERTDLAWRRTALGLFGNGVLVVVRHERSFPGTVAIALSASFVIASVLVLTLGIRRSRGLRARGEDIAPATTSVVILGAAVVLLCLATTVAVGSGGRR